MRSSINSPCKILSFGEKMLCYSSSSHGTSFLGLVNATLASRASTWQCTTISSHPPPNPWSFWPSVTSPMNCTCMLLFFFLVRLFTCSFILLLLVVASTWFSTSPNVCALPCTPHFVWNLLRLPCSREAFWIAVMFLVYIFFCSWLYTGIVLQFNYLLV